jgi:hypothetical protein
MNESVIEKISKRSRGELTFQDASRLGRLHPGYVAHINNDLEQDAIAVDSEQDTFLGDGLGLPGGWGPFCLGGHSSVLGKKAVWRRWSWRERKKEFEDCDGENEESGNLAGSR